MDCFAGKSFCYVLQDIRSPGVIHGECSKLDFLGCTVISGNARSAEFKKITKCVVWVILCDYIKKRHFEVILKSYLVFLGSFFAICKVEV